MRFHWHTDSMDMVWVCMECQASWSKHNSMLTREPFADSSAVIDSPQGDTAGRHPQFTSR